jgi:hypothetical protein
MRARRALRVVDAAMCALMSMRRARARDECVY